MHGDFTLDPLHYRDGVSRVLIQQGRVQLDSDYNEHTESLLRFLRGLGRDLIGPHGGVNDSFRLDPSANGLQIARGEYYVDGIRCLLPPDRDLWELFDDLAARTTASQAIPLSKLPNYVPPAKDDEGKTLVYYLDVFERHLSSAEDDTLRETALLGADTASRAVITWQIRTLVVDSALNDLVTAAQKFGWPYTPDDLDVWYIALNVRLRTGVRMRAAAIGEESTNPCVISPKAGYRGMENRLFRVEIHDGGDALAQPPRKPALKWSDDNGSIVYPVQRVEGKTVYLGSLGRDARAQLCINDWVEVVDDDVILRPQFRPLLQVTKITPGELSVELSGDPGVGSDPFKHPILRRWSSDLLPIDLDAPIELPDGDGLQVQFSELTSPRAGFRPGDYWLIPTRTAEGEIVWPKDPQGNPRDLPPNGVDHHYAPLLLGRRDGAAVGFTHLHRTFKHLAVKPATAISPAPGGGATLPPNPSNQVRSNAETRSETGKGARRKR